MILAEQIIETARSWVDVPFQHQGRSRYGVDCIGLVICVFEEFGGFSRVPRPAYPRQVQDAELLRELESRCTRTDREEPGGLVLIRWPMMEHPTHVAICTGPNIVHAYKRVRRVCEVGYRGQWPRWSHSFYRLPGVVYA